MSPRANARRPAEARRRAAVGADLAAVLVERAELGQVPMRLLEVVAEDLLELGRAALALTLSAHSTNSLVQRWPARA